VRSLGIEPWPAGEPPKALPDCASAQFPCIQPATCNAAGKSLTPAHNPIVVLRVVLIMPRPCPDDLGRAGRYLYLFLKAKMYPANSRTNDIFTFVAHRLEGRESRHLRMYVPSHFKNKGILIQWPTGCLHTLTASNSGTRRAMAGHTTSSQSPQSTC
jgi:hypothetical protein